MEFRILGPVEVISGDRTLRLGGPKQRAVLVHLLLRADQPVTADRLIDEVWGEEPPRTAVTTLRGYVSHLRKALGPDRLEARSGGYVLHADPPEIDARRFGSLAEEGHRLLPIDPAAATMVLEEALSLWRGSPFGTLGDQASLQAETARLEELRLGAMEDLVSAKVALGRDAAVIPELETLVERHPLRERLWGQLIVALYRSGRQAEALSAYRRVRDLLAEELVIDPSAELQRIHEQVLRQDPALDVRGEPLRGYRLLEPVGAGAFGTVHRAFQAQVGREVAVKVIHPTIANDPEFIRRFEAEAQLVARLEHPHIVPLYDYWRDPDGAFLVMRYLRGGDLRTVLAEGPLAPEETLRLLDQVALGLAAAHHQGVIHRDVKPANILFDPEGNAYLSDFGIAKELAAAAEITRPGGTPSPLAYYLAPEEIRGEPATPRTDVYSLGLVLYEVLAGRHPFAETPSGEVIEKQLAERVPSLRHVRADVPAGVDEVIARATAKDAADRYPQPGMLAEAFRSALAAAPAAALGEIDIRNPYKGLRAFYEPDAPDFFGREDLTERLVARVAEGGSRSRLLAVVGPSGSGKSSIVRAGVIPALRRGALPASETWFVVDMVPGTVPFLELEGALLKIAVDPPDGVADRLRRDDRGLVEVAADILPPDGSELLLVIDQFEELFTLVADEDDRSTFLTALVVAATDPGSRIRILITLRADFFDRPLQYQGFGDLLAARAQAVPPLSVEELERAVSAPARRVGIDVEAPLVAEIVADVSGQPAALPLLQHALAEMFDQRTDSALTLDAYHRIGGVSGALAGRAEDLYSRLTAAGSEAARQLFLRLVTLGDQPSEDTRRRVLRAELTALEVEREAMETAIDTFGARRLLTFDRHPTSRGPTVEVAHEALLGEWGRLRGWIEAAREDVRMHRRLAAAAAEWTEAGRDPSFLFRGDRLSRFEAWAETSGLALTRDEREYLQAALAQREAEREVEEKRQARERTLERRSLVRTRALVAVFGVLALVSSGLTALTLSQRARAEREAEIATARGLAAAAMANLDVDPERSILLAMEAVRSYRSAGGPVGEDAVEALHGAIQATRVVMTLRHPSTANVAFSPDGKLIATGGSIAGTGQTDLVIWDGSDGDRLRTLSGHAGDIQDVAFSPDVSMVASASVDGTVVLWDPHIGRRLKTLPGHSQGAQGVDFSPHGRLVATSGTDGVIRIWDPSTGRLRWTLKDPDGASYCGLDFSPAGSRIAVATCFGQGAYIWNLGTRRRSVTLDAPLDTFTVSWGRDSRRVAAGGLDDVARVFDARTGRRLLTLGGHSGSVYQAQFAPRGGEIATASTDGTAKLWDARTGRELLTLAGHRGQVGDVAFSPNGKHLLTSGGEGTARMWKITPEGGGEALTLAPEIGPLTSVSYSPDGELLLSVPHAFLAADGRVRVWDESSGVLVNTFGEGETVFDAVFVPDGRGVATVGGRGASVRAATSGRVLSVLSPAAHNWFSIAVSPDGRFIAGTTGSGSVVVWDAASGEVAHRLVHSELPGLAGAVPRAAFSSDGALMASASWDGTAKVWDLASERPIVSVTPHGGQRVHSVALSPHGDHLLTAGADGTVVLWEVPSGDRVRTMTGHQGQAQDVAFSPDGTVAASAGDDNTVRLWDPFTGQELLTLTGHRLAINEIVFSPDGSRLATASGDGTVRVYLLRLSELMDLAEQRLTRGFTTEECREYLQLEGCPPRLGAAFP